jgi:phage terminase Nu1 subunit (DNA packaging protein)
MKLQRYDMEINWYGDKIHIIASDDGEWVKASDAEALKLAVERATANMVHAQNRAVELEKALREIALMPCVCFRNIECGSCSAREALKTLEAKG